MLIGRSQYHMDLPGQIELDSYAIAVRMSSIVSEVRLVSRDCAFTCEHHEATKHSVARCGIWRFSRLPAEDFEPRGSSFAVLRTS